MKKFFALLLTLVLALSVVACAAPAAEEAAPAPEASEEVAAPEAAEKVELKVIAAQYGPNTPAWWADFVEKFNAANENINLVVDVVSWNDIYTVVNTRIAIGDAPDLLNIDVFADY
ncbi:MAG: extracellular solute-binding protein, partial [Clostridia bacterium]|nr:extracellular solute-binding protein [Clostridia bacterium]